jgi:hypothetical protein
MSRIERPESKPVSERTPDNLKLVALNWLRIVDASLYKRDSRLQSLLASLRKMKDGVAIAAELQDAVADFQFRLRDVLTKDLGISEETWKAAIRELAVPSEQDDR